MPGNERGIDGSSLIPFGGTICQKLLYNGLKAQLAWKNVYRIICEKVAIIEVQYIR